MDKRNIHIEGVNFRAPFRCIVTFRESLDPNKETPYVISTREFNLKNKNEKFVRQVRDLAYKLLKVNNE